MVLQGRRQIDDYNQKSKKTKKQEVPRGQFFVFLFFCFLDYSQNVYAYKNTPLLMRERAIWSGLRIGQTTYDRGHEPMLRVEPRPLGRGEIDQLLVIFRITHERVDRDSEGIDCL